MGYYPSGKEEIKRELEWLKRARNHSYICKKCYTEHSKQKCPDCNSTSKKNKF